MAKKIGLLILIVIISIILASIYGILHNQISYSISSEYFTKFKFDQIGKWLHQVENERIAISFVGIISTWWFGLLLGLIIGIVGILIGKFLISNLNTNWNLPAELIDRKNFLTAGTMHNFSYFGGIVGLIYGIIYQLKIKKASAQQRTELKSK